jgi:hypothetical protein
MRWLYCSVDTALLVDGSGFGGTKNIITSSFGSSIMAVDARMVQNGEGSNDQSGGSQRGCAVMWEEWQDCENAWVPDGFFCWSGVSKSNVADVWTPLDIPLIWCWFGGFQTSGPVRTFFMSRVGWLKLSGPSSPDICGRFGDPHWSCPNSKRQPR